MGDKAQADKADKEVKGKETPTTNQAADFADDIKDIKEQGEHPPRKLTPSQALIEVIRLMSLSPHHKYMFLAELEWAVIPPLRLGQFRLFHDKGRVVGFVSWAMVSDEVAERIKNGSRRLKPGEWRCGGTRVVMDVVAPFGGGEEMVNSLSPQ